MNRRKHVWVSTVTFARARHFIWPQPILRSSTSLGWKAESWRTFPLSPRESPEPALGWKTPRAGGRENFCCPPEGPRSNQANSNGCVALIATRALQLRVTNGYVWPTRLNKTCTLLDLFATKGVGGISMGLIVRDGEGVSAVAFVRNSPHFAFVRIWPRLLPLKRRP